jgi:hypothetical protein
LHYATIFGINLLAQIHQLHLAIEGLSLSQNHPLDQLSEHADFMGDHINSVGKVMDVMSEQITKQDTNIAQLANMVNNLIGVTEAQKKELESHKKSLKDHCQVINMMTVKYMSANDHIEGLEWKVFPQVGGNTVCEFQYIDVFLLGSCPSPL